MENKSLNVCFLAGYLFACFVRLSCSYCVRSYSAQSCCFRFVTSRLSCAKILRWQIFNSKLALASPETATDADFASIEGVIGHEVSYSCRFFADCFIGRFSDTSLTHFAPPCAALWFYRGCFSTSTTGLGTGSSTTSVCWVVIFELNFAYK